MRLISLVLSVFVLFGCGPSKDDVAPEIEAELTDGTLFKLSELRGKYVVLDFWGSWCGPCLAEAPQLVELYEEFGNDVAFVSVAFEKNDKRWKQTSERLGFVWKYQIVEISPILLGSPISRAYGVSEIPAKFIISPEGKVIKGLDFNQMREYLSNSIH